MFGRNWHDGSGTGESLSAHADGVITTVQGDTPMEENGTKLLTDGEVLNLRGRAVSNCARASVQMPDHISGR